MTWNVAKKFLAVLCIQAFAFCSLPAQEGLELAQYNRKFSCFNEERIIQKLSRKIPNISRTYVDLGAGDGVGWSNSARLALCGWRGLAVEADHAQVVKFLKTYRKIKNVTVANTIVTPLNVCDLLESFNIPKNFGVLSLDIDSYDYFVLEELLKRFRPSIIVTEINEKFPPPIEFTVLYTEGHQWDYTHFFGQSICQLEKLCHLHNYSIVALEYNNAILVASELYQGKSLTADEAYVQGYQMREDRNLHFPWNRDMEFLLSSTPEENLNFLNRYFANYEGKYQLRLRGL